MEENKTKVKEQNVAQEVQIKEAPKKKSPMRTILIILFILVVVGYSLWFFVLGGNGN